MCELGECAMGLLTIAACEVQMLDDDAFVFPAVDDAVYSRCWRVYLENKLSINKTGYLSFFQSRLCISITYNIGISSLYISSMNISSNQR